MNQVLKKNHFPLPTIDDILPKLSKAKVFTICDVKHGLWHIKLEEESPHTPHHICHPQGTTQEEANKDHDKKLSYFRTRYKEQNIKLNLDKFKLR